MKDSGIKILNRGMEGDIRFGQMEAFMRDTGNTISLMDVDD